MGIVSRVKQFCFVDLRILKYRLLSDCKRVSGKPNPYHPLLLKGKGRITFGKNVQIGVTASPNYYSHYSYFEARTDGAEIVIGDNVSINNAFTAISFTKISIGNNVLIGANCSIIDSDGHDLNVGKRSNGEPKTAEVILHDNVFLGSNVSILKGVTIGQNTVIGYGSVVVHDIPENVIAVGNPARVIRNL